MLLIYEVMTYILLISSAVKEIQLSASGDPIMAV
jgi:hypothetical protein